MKKVLLLLCAVVICVSPLASCLVTDEMTEQMNKHKGVTTIVEITDKEPENTTGESAEETTDKYEGITLSPHPGVADLDYDYIEIIYEDYAKRVFVYSCLDHMYLQWCQAKGYIPENINLNLMEDEYVNLFGRTEDGTNIGLMDYYDIPENTYIEYWEARRQGNAEYYNFDPEKIKEFDRDFQIELSFKAWFSHDPIPADSEVFISPYYKYDDPKSVRIICETDTVHTARYYTINGFLIEYVGEDNFNEFKNKFAGTENFNILNFVDYFDITKEEFDAIFSSDDYHAISAAYKSEYVYGTEEMQKLYFEKHPIANYTEGTLINE